MQLASSFDRWRIFVNGSPLRRLGHDAMVTAGLSLFARGLGFLKEILVAAAFGLSGALDVYIMAFVLIGFPVSILLNAIQTALISSVAASSGNPANGDALYLPTVLFALAGLAVLLPLWLVVLPYILPWLSSGFSPEKRQSLEVALFWLVPYYFLNGVNLLGYGMLQAKGRYLANGLLPSLTPIATIMVLFLWGADGGWHVLVTALDIGTALECLLLISMLHGGSQFSMFGVMNIPKLKNVLDASLALLPGTLMLAVGPVIEQAIAASMGEGTNAALGYGVKFPAALQSILVTAIGITALPYFADQLGRNQPEYCLHSLNKLTRWLMAGGLLLAIPLGIFSAEIVELLYQRGAFDAAAVARVAPIQFAYFMQLPFALVAMLGVKALAALGRTRLISLYSFAIVIAQALLAYWLGLSFGASGIAWSATLISGALAVATYFNVRSVLTRLCQ